MSSDVNPAAQPAALGIAHRLRKSPFYDATRRWGAQGFTVYNHMLMPVWYESPETDYWKLINGVTLWDVAAQRQVEIIGPDALELVRRMTPRDLSRMAVGQCKYVPIVDHDGGMINDPVLLRVAEQQYWLSLADSDVMLWAKGIAQGAGLDTRIHEPDASPLALQGPHADDVAEAVFGSWVRELGFFRFRDVELDGMPLLVARSGWSGQGGFEIYLRDAGCGNQLWERLMQAGRSWDIAPSTPSGIERIESGLLSYGNDMTLENNPLELGLEKFCDLDQAFEFIGKAALRRVRDRGVTRKLIGLGCGDQRVPANEHWWPVVTRPGEPCGKVTSSVYSPRLRQYIALALVAVEHSTPGTPLRIDSPHGELAATACRLPFL